MNDLLIAIEERTKWFKERNITPSTIELSEQTLQFLIDKYSCEMVGAGYEILSRPVGSLYGHIVMLCDLQIKIALLPFLEFKIK